MSTTQAIAYHSITIGEKNTWDDWHLIPSSRPLVAPPGVKVNLIEIPGGDGFIDLTDSMIGRTMYQNRSGSWEFIVANSGQVEAGSHYAEWYERYTEIMTYLHGQEFDAILDDDPAYYYTGRFAVDEWQSNAGNSTITINYNVGPYKQELYASSEKWLWDPFNFETGVIRNYKDLPVKGTTSIVYVLNAAVSTVPLITCSAKGMTVKYNGITYPLSRGKNEMRGVQLQPGENTLVFTGTGRVTIQATGGLL